MQRKHWDIEDPHGFVAKGSAPRRMVEIYKAQRGIAQPQAVAELIEAGYAHLVSIPLPSTKAEDTRKSGPKNTKAA